MSPTPSTDGPNSTPPPTDGAGKAGGAKSFTAFLATVLEQLSITSWMPSVFLVGNAAVLLTLVNDDQVSLSAAVQRLIDLEWGVLVVILFAVIIAAIIVQAFEFEALRFLEGYYRSRPLGRRARWRIEAFRKQHIELETRGKDLGQAAFTTARTAALNAPETSPRIRRLWNVLEKVVFERKLTTRDRALLTDTRTLNWIGWADPAALHAWDVVRIRLGEFPEKHRVLPTRLGNAMRAAEDEVELGEDEDLEGRASAKLAEGRVTSAFVLRHAVLRV